MRILHTKALLQELPGTPDFSGFAKGMTSLLAAWAVLLGAQTQVHAGDYSIGNPSAGEQYLLELINRARLDPSAEATRLSIPLNQGVTSTISTAPKQPLAFNPNLSSAARAHSQWMLANNIFSHTGAYGTDPKTRMSNAGYSFTGSWGYGENLGLGSGKTNLQDYVNYVHWLLFNSSGHRVNMMTANHSEVGLATERGYYTYSTGRYDSLMVAEDFANSDATPGPLVLGVVYGDLDADGFYDIGEGISGATLEVAGAQYTATTSASGGWAIPVPADGSYTVTAQIPGVGSKISIAIVSGGLNEKVDFRVTGSGISASSSAFGFGLLTEITSTRFYSDTYGYLNFSGDGSDKTWAWSESLKVWLVTDGNTVHSADYGYLSPGDAAGWVRSSKLGWIRIHSHGSAAMPDSSPWVWSNSYGWVISNRAGTGQFFWCQWLNSWFSAGASGTLWSYNYGWLTAGSNAGWVNSSAVGWIYIGDFSGWVWSARLGWISSNGDGTATYFWHSTYGWLAANGTGWVWSYTYGYWM